MYTLTTGIYQQLTEKEEYFVIILGLDNAGKTVRSNLISDYHQTLLERIKMIYMGAKGLRPDQIGPTVGLNVGKINIKGCRMNFWDLGGQRQLQSIWTKYYEDCHGLIFVVDSTDMNRIEECKTTLENVVRNDLIEGVPMLMLANKQDLPGALKIHEIKEIFNKIAERLEARDSRVLCVSALNGSKRGNGMDVFQITAKQRTPSASIPKLNRFVPQQTKMKELKEEEDSEKEQFNKIYQNELNQNIALDNKLLQYDDEPPNNQIPSNLDSGSENLIPSALDGSNLVETVVSSILVAASTTSSLSSFISQSSSSSLIISDSVTTAAASSTPGASVSLNQSTVSSLATTVIFALLKLVFGHVPLFIFRILSTTLSLTVTLDFWGLIYLLIFGILLAFVTYRYRVLSAFSNLQAPPPLQKNAFDLKPDLLHEYTDSTRNPGYPDEFMNAFLSSIKVFGYLDRPVFQELAKNLKTKVLKPGEILFHGDNPQKGDLDFYVVVEGKVQIFIKSNDAGGEDDILDNHSDENISPEHSDKRSESKAYLHEWAGHHLLNEVRKGGTVTSLFSILSILSEDLELPSPISTPTATTTASQPANSKKEDLSSSTPEFKLSVSTTSISSLSRSASPINSSDEKTGELTPSFTKIGIDQVSDKALAGSMRILDQEAEKRKEQEKKCQVHPNLVARAACKTILAVIPASSFRNLSQKYPKAAAHMVSVIVTRFQRVTFSTLQRYLGLSQELLEIEKKVNEISGSGLPASLFPPDLIESCAWRLSHQSLESPTRSSSFSPEVVPSSYSRASNALFELNCDSRFLSAEFDTDEQIRDAVFSCVAQFIGLSSGAESLLSPEISAAHTPRREKKSSASSSQFGANNPVERYYYGGRGSGVSSYAQSTPSRKNSILGFNDDDIMSTTSSHADSMNTEEMAGVGAVDVSDIPDIQLLFFKQGKTVVAEGERCAGLYFVLDGTLEASTGIRSDMNRRVSYTRQSRSQKKLFLIQPGGLAGYLGAMSGNPSFVNISAKTDVLVGLMPKPILDRYIDKYPNVLLCLAKRLVQQLSPLVFHIDFALEWGQVNAGQVLCRQGEPSHSIFIVLTGRLRSIKERTAASSSEPSLEILGEFGQSESVGELEVLTDSLRPSTIHAIRDSEVAIMPKTLFNALALRHPDIMMTISRMIALRSSEMNNHHKSLGSNNINLRTVALLPVNSDVPIMSFAQNLNNALLEMDANPALIQTRSIMTQLGKHAFTRLGRLKLMSWLHEKEEIHRIVLYVADGGVTSPWTHRCIRQADCVLLIGLQEGDPAVGEYEQLLLSMKTTARKELVLLNSKKSCGTGTTAAWLKSRLWIHAHHHIQMTLPTTGLSFDRMKQKHKQNTLINLQSHFQNIYNSTLTFNNSKSTSNTPKVFTGIRSDFSRLSRRLLSKSIGLVLGGGGARGIAHVGALRAIEESGIPIDIVGGTSIGAFVGGLYARENDQVSVYGRSKSFSTDAGSNWRTILDLTYPFVSMTTGNEFNRAIWKIFADTQIEDCWLPYFCVTTNITSSREEVHTHGHIWRYIRASMSLAGWLPPMCENGSMLMDGGYLNNLPANVMQSQMGAQVIIAIDVGGVYSSEPVTYGDSLSGFWAIFNKYNPLGKNYGPIPKLGEIQGRLAYASSVVNLEETVKMEGVHYLAPPILGFGLLEFVKFKEIEQVGYDYMKDVIAKWSEDGTLSEQFGVQGVESGPGRGRRASI